MVRRTLTTLSAVALLLAPLPAAQEMVITKPGTPLYHWPGCPVVKDTTDVLAMTRAQAHGRGLKPHDACDPSKAPETSPDPAVKKLPPVYIDADGKYYHRQTCKELGAKPRKVSVEEAVKEKRWPCRVCKPPIRARKK